MGQGLKWARPIGEHRDARRSFSILLAGLLAGGIVAFSTHGVRHSAAAGELNIPNSLAVPASDEKAAKNDATKPETPATGNKNNDDRNNDQNALKKDADLVFDKIVVGDPLAPGITALLPEEIVAGFKRRNIEAQFARFVSYSGQKLNSTSGRYTGSEVTGNCRLSWFDHLLRNPLKAPVETEQFTRVLHTYLISDHRGLDHALALAGEKLDLGAVPPREQTPVVSPEAALDVLRQALIGAQASYATALSPLTQGEIDRLARGVHVNLTRNGNVGHTLADRGSGRHMCDLMEKMDRAAMVAAARSLVPLTDPAFLAQLAKLPADKSLSVEGVSGTIARRIETPAGDILIGGPGPNNYQLDAMPNVAAVIDLGGNDIYNEGTCSVERPVLVLIDLAGNDAYRGSKPGIQGGSVLGVSLLVDAQGNDVYQAKDVAQGSTLGGVGILIDQAGNDAYTGVRRLQGQALGGIGLLIDRAGNDDYHAAMWAQGFAGPMGFGVLDDGDGADHYYAGGLYPDSYDETPGYEGWSQGIGAGIRQVGNGGIGVILDGGGDDIYEYDYISHGGGYWLGLGFARDFGGNDQRLGATRRAFDGGPRGESRFQRFSNGFGCHYALGFLFDDAGDDHYEGTIMCVGFAWDDSVGMLCDFGGNDTYVGSQGNGAQAGLGVIYDYNGDDVYRGYGQARASSSISYHDMPYCGGNFSFVIDYGGTDKYGCGAQNNSYTMRGTSGGFLIDRPKQEEIDRARTEGPRVSARE